jgi:putative resolvase
MARGDEVVSDVTEIAAGLAGERSKFQEALTDAQMGVLVVEPRDRLTRFGYDALAAMSWWTISWP